MRIIREALNRYPFPVLDLTDRNIFIAALLFLYGLMKASASSLFEEALRRDMPAKLRLYYERHLDEEREHEKWLLRDLQESNIAVPKVNWRAAQITGMQYYLIKHVSPQAFLGYCAFMEYKPTPMDVVETLEEIHGKTIMRTVRFHAENDIRHGGELLTAIADMQNELDLKLIADNILWTGAMFTDAYNEIRGSV